MVRSPTLRRRRTDGSLIENIAVRGMRLLLIVAIILFWVSVTALISSATAAVPESCRQFQRHLTSEAYSVIGLNAPVSVLAAQIQQESGCRPGVSSPVGAQGLTQFMPATARDMALRYPRDLGPADPLNWRWAISAQVRYMRDLVPTPWVTECDWWAAKLAAYNGGEGWLRRDQRICNAQTTPDAGNCAPCNDRVWFDHVELRSARAGWAYRENRAYPRRILDLLTPQYVTAGYGRGVGCPSELLTGAAP